MNVQSILIAALCMATASLSAGERGLSQETEEVEKISWDLYLSELPEELDCRFTVERMTFRAGTPREVRRRDPSPFFRYDLTRDPNIKTVEALVEKLRREMKGIRVIQNAKNPAVIHLIAERLSRIEGYGMDKKLDVTYSGSMGELAGEVGKQVPGIGFSRGGAIGQVLGDFRTQVKVDVKNQTVREVLTGCVPLKDYSQVLWIATTWKKEDGQYQTTVRHQGRPLGPSKN